MKLLAILFVLIAFPAMAVNDVQSSKITGHAVLQGLDLRAGKITAHLVMKEAPARGSHGYIFGQWRSVADRCEWNT